MTCKIAIPKNPICFSAPEFAFRSADSSYQRIARFIGGMRSNRNRRRGDLRRAMLTFAQVGAQNFSLFQGGFDASFSMTKEPKQ
jgi:hypothetical protein